MAPRHRAPDCRPLHHAGNDAGTPRAPKVPCYPCPHERVIAYGIEAIEDKRDQVEIDGAQSTGPLDQARQSSAFVWRPRQRPTSTEAPKS